MPSVLETVFHRNENAEITMERSEIKLKASGDTSRGVPGYPSATGIVEACAGSRK